MVQWIRPCISAQDHALIPRSYGLATIMLVCMEHKREFANDFTSGLSIMNIVNLEQSDYRVKDRTNRIE